MVGTISYLSSRWQSQINWSIFRRNMWSTGSQAPTTRTPILPLLVSAGAVVCMVAGIWLGDYGIRRFEIRAGYWLATAAYYSAIPTLAGIVGAVTGAVLGHRARRGYPGFLSAAAVVLAYIAAAGSIMVIGKVLGMDWPPLRSSNEERAVAALRTLPYWLDQFQLKDPQHRLPRTLAELEGEGLPAFWATGNFSGYLFTYVPGPQAEGRARYAVLARPRTFGSSGRANFYSDETGVVRWTLDDRPARATDEPYGEP
ncbi:MAG TPA: hypothetical protein VNK82_06095 [Terriglobales bacterium]|nr:hypothetical protein [Terriglobales bacterium]